MLSCTPKMSTVEPRPLAGNHPAQTENTKTVTKPDQNVGKLNPSIDPAMMVFETGCCGFTPANIPNGIPKSIAIIIAVMASSSVAGK